MSVPFTQTREYLSWHQALGEKTFYKEFFDRGKEGDKEGGGVAAPQQTLAIVASLVINLRIGKVLYVPYGPYLSSFFYSQDLERTNILEKQVLSYLYELAKEEGCVFVRLENFNNLPSFRLKETLLSFTPPKKTFAKEGIFQPRMEWWLDLKLPEGTMYDNFHKDHRYSIRRAQKENILFEIVDLDQSLSFDEPKKEKYFREFMNLMKITGERDDFKLYEEGYYRAFFRDCPDSRIKKFLIFTKQVSQAEETNYLSVALVVFFDKIANLVFAGSVTEGREKGLNHLMQWEAIKYAKRLGAEVYNFGGIYENGYGRSSLQGVTSFKKKFNGYAKFHGDFLDLPVKKIKYFFYILKKIFT